MKRINLLIAAAALALAPLAAAAHDFKVGNLVIESPWSRATGQTRPGVGYMVIRNTGQQAERLLGAESRIAEAVMLHSNVIENGVAKMSPSEGLEIPAGGDVTLAPKSEYHLMLTGLKQKLVEGDTFPVTLIFQNAGRVDVTFVTAGAGALSIEAD